MIQQVTPPHPHVVYLPFLRRPTTATGEWSVTHVPVRVVQSSPHPAPLPALGNSSGPAS